MEEYENQNIFLSIRDLKVQYTSGGSVIHAVNGVSLELEKGKTLAIVGETGAGKTSIAKAILRVLPDISAKITGGQVYLDGIDLLTLSPEAMRKVRGRKVSMVFQDPMTALNPTMRVGHQIAEVIKKHNMVSKREAERQAIDMLEMVGIPAERFREYPHQFSGGMKQRVVIAIALACDPDLLLADEPTSALDVTIQAQVLDMITKLRETYNTSMILISHDLGVVAENCDNIAVIYAGKIVEYGSIIDVFNHPAHPYTVGLFGALPHMNGNVKRLDHIKGLPPDPTNLPVGCSFHPRCFFSSDACREGDIAMFELSPGHLCRCCNINRAALKEEKHDSAS